jgi:hypothetical protein
MVTSPVFKVLAQRTLFSSTKPTWRGPLTTNSTSEARGCQWGPVKDQGPQP